MGNATHFTSLQFSQENGLSTDTSANKKGTVWEIGGGSIDMVKEIQNCPDTSKQTDAHSEESASPPLHGKVSGGCLDSSMTM